jgi:hypothetical protein
VALAPTVAERWCLVIAALLAASLALGCENRGASQPPVGPQARASIAGALALPEVTGFAAGATSRTAGYVRRTYRRGTARVEVTLARMPMSPDDYASWVKTSTASFPQAALDLPAADANGFYQCSDGPVPSCDLLIQLRAGLHLEIRGGGTSSRDDVDALAHGLPLATLAARPAE